MTRTPYRDAPFWSRRQLLLALLLLILSAALWWALQGRSPDTADGKTRPRLPDYIVWRFSAVETDAAGAPSRKLSAQELRHYAADEISELSEPRMELFQADGPPWHARAATGTVYSGGDQVRLEGDVRLDRAGDAVSRPAHLETEQIDIWREQGLAETDLPVRILSDGDTLKANGMKLWYNEPTRSTFHGRARIRLAPEQEARP